jgi:hypothetical protein
LGSVRLVDVEPDLVDTLSPEDKQLANQVSLPVAVADAGELDLDQLHEESGAFGALILDGMVLHRVLIGEHSALRVLGPGDIVTASPRTNVAILEYGGHRVAERAHLALLEDHAMLALRRFPRLAVMFQLRMAEQEERVAAQLVICQLPRVEDRVLAMMWLLAESWGRVTSAGTSLPLSLTHDAWGELVGAKRPTITLALQRLAERGAAVRLDRGWLLLESLGQVDGDPVPRIPVSHQLAVIRDRGSVWEPESESASTLGLGLQEAVENLRATFERSALQHVARIELAGTLRTRSRQVRERIQRERLLRQVPS